jgi:cell wall-associated NlpC family hydrolase
LWLGGNKVTRKAWLVGSSMVLLLGSLIPSVLASSLSQKKQHLGQLQKQVTQTNQTINAAQNKVKNLHNVIQQDQTQIQLLSQSIATDRYQLQQLAQVLQLLNQKISDNQAKLTAEELQLKNTLRAEYETGNVPYLAVLFRATSWSDFLTRLEMMSKVAQADKDLLNQVQVLQQSLDQQKLEQAANYKALQVKNQQLQTLEQQNLKVEQQHKVALDTTNQTLQVAQKQYGLLESQIKLTKSQIRLIEQATLRAEAEMHNRAYLSQATRNLQSVNVNSMINYAESFVGLPYIWGGSTPQPGFDCSGFTQYVFRHFGVYVGRDTWAQFAEGVPVSKSNLKPGDLLFFSTYASGASHVGIYIGNDMMVDSEDAGLIVTHVFSNAYWNARYIGARRYIK